MRRQQQRLRDPIAKSARRSERRSPRRTWRQLQRLRWASNWAKSFAGLSEKCAEVPSSGYLHIGRKSSQCMAPKVSKRPVPSHAKPDGAQGFRMGRAEGGQSRREAGRRVAGKRRGGRKERKDRRRKGKRGGRSRSALQRLAASRVGCETSRDLAPEPTMRRVGRGEQKGKRGEEGRWEGLGEGGRNGIFSFAPFGVPSGPPLDPLTPDYKVGLRVYFNCSRRTRRQALGVQGSNRSRRATRKQTNNPHLRLLAVRQ